MPHLLDISPDDDTTRARRHVLSQQMYRLRKRYRLLKDSGMEINAKGIAARYTKLMVEYNLLGGYPVHKGNIL